jgi:hypothetical protein
MYYLCEDLILVSIQVLLSWCSTEDIVVCSRLVPTKYIVELVLN